MTRIEKKCDTYNAEVEANRKLIKFYKLIVIGPAILMMLLGIALTIVTGVMKVPYFYALLIFVVIGVLYLLIIRSILNKQFDRNNLKIVDKFYRFYKLSNNPLVTSIKLDNQNFAPRINTCGENTLYVFTTGDRMNFITAAIPTLTTISLKSADKFEQILAQDFGMFIIPVDDVDNYRDNVLMVNYNKTVLKITFKDHIFMDTFIPTKDFYFNADKKQREIEK